MTSFKERGSLAQIGAKAGDRVVFVWNGIMARKVYKPGRAVFAEGDLCFLGDVAGEMRRDRFGHEFILEEAISVENFL